MSVEDRTVETWHCAECGQQVRIGLCENCGQRFTIKVPKQRYCRPMCQQYAESRRRTEGARVGWEIRRAKASK